MIDELVNLTAFSDYQLLIAAIAVFFAGLVRGFAGFGLSAVLMASIVSIVPPITLIPICFLLEAVASVVMFRGGVKQADMPIVWGLVITSAIGAPIGLFATNSIDTELSKTIALCIVMALTATQLFKLKWTFLASRAGLYLSGLTAGVVTGLASVGGMVVALYVLASEAEAKRMRASLVMFLFLGMFTSFIYLSFFHMLTAQALWRVLFLAPVMLLGLGLGSLLFRPSLQQIYRPACLLFLLSLCLVGLVRQLG